MAALIRGLVNTFELIPHSLIALLARVVLGLVFWNSFLTKVDLATWSIKEKTFTLFRDLYKVPVLPPELATYMATGAEFLCPLLLWAGLATRFSALALIGMTLVIQLFVFPGSYLVHGTWAVGLLYLVKHGAGKLSLDHLIAGRN